MCDLSDVTCTTAEQTERFLNHMTSEIQAWPVHIPLPSSGYLAELFSCLNNLNTNRLDKQRGEQKAASPTPALHPYALSRGNLRSQLPRFSIQPQAALKLFSSCTLRPSALLSISPRSGGPHLWVGAALRLGHRGGEKVLWEARRPPPRELSWNPPEPGGE